MHTLRAEQFVPIGLSEAWKFLSDPNNLALITPPAMDFRVTSNIESERIYAGMIISYRVRPLFGISVKWVTEITHVNEPYFFVDEQRFGPYSFWHHQHTLREVAGGVSMIDEVNYKVPGGILAGPLHRFIIRPRLEAIFAFRRASISKLFGTPDSDSEHTEEP